MPRNRRPDGYLVSNPDYKNTTIEQRRQMQNTWDLLAEQEKANELTQEKIRQEKINNDRLIEALNQTNQINKQINDYNNEALKDIENMKLERLKLEHYYKICEKEDIDYDDIKLFFNKLQQSDPNIDDQLQELYIKLNNLNNEEKSQIRVYEYKKKNYTDTYNRVLIKRNEVDKELDNISFITKLFNKNKVLELKNKLNKLNERLNELNKLIDKDIDLKSIYNKNKSEKDRINKEIDSLVEQNKQYIYNKCMDFLNFRKNHYNKEIELLFKKLNIAPLDTKEIIKTGSKEDYIKYIRDHII